MMAVPRVSFSGFRAAAGARGASALQPQRHAYRPNTHGLPMDAKQLYSPKGRINRAPYWIGFIILNSVFGLLERSPNPGVIVLWTVAFYVSCCLVIGRLHDLDRTGWWAA